jgi:hypothetical protein
MQFMLSVTVSNQLHTGIHTLIAQQPLQLLIDLPISTAKHVPGDLFDFQANLPDGHLLQRAKCVPRSLRISWRSISPGSIGNGGPPPFDKSLSSSKNTSFIRDS